VKCWDFVAGGLTSRMILPGREHITHLVAKGGWRRYVPTSEQLPQFYYALAVLLLRASISRHPE
jgi:hypothetical protein